MIQIDLSKRNGKPMSLKEYILLAIKSNGRLSDEQLTALSGRPKASVRRTRKELQTEKKIKASAQEAQRSGSRAVAWQLVEEKELVG